MTNYDPLILAVSSHRLISILLKELFNHIVSESSIRYLILAAIPCPQIQAILYSHTCVSKLFFKA